MGIDGQRATCGDVAAGHGGTDLHGLFREVYFFPLLRVVEVDRDQRDLCLVVQIAVAVGIDVWLQRGIAEVFERATFMDAAGHFHGVALGQGAGCDCLVRCKVGGIGPVGVPDLVADEGRTDGDTSGLAACGCRNRSRSVDRIDPSVGRGQNIDLARRGGDKRILDRGGNGGPDPVEGQRTGKGNTDTGCTARNGKRACGSDGIHPRAVCGLNQHVAGGRDDACIGHADDLRAGVSVDLVLRDSRAQGHGQTGLAEGRRDGHGGCNDVDLGRIRGADIDIRRIHIAGIIGIDDAGQRFGVDHVAHIDARAGNPDTRLAAGNRHGTGHVQRVDGLFGRRIDIDVAGGGDVAVFDIGKRPDRVARAAGLAADQVLRNRCTKRDTDACLAKPEGHGGRHSDCVDRTLVDCVDIDIATRGIDRRARDIGRGIRLDHVLAIGAGTGDRGAGLAKACRKGSRARDSVDCADLDGEIAARARKNGEGTSQSVCQQPA